MSLRAWVSRLMVATVCAVCPAVAAAANAPATNYDADNHSQNVYLPGPEGSLKEIAWVSGGGWGHISTILPGGSLGSASATNVDPENHSQNEYFAGPDGSLREISWTLSGGWDHVSVVAPPGSLGSAPATNFDPENHSQNVYFAGPDGSLREISWTPSGHWDAMSVITSAGTLGPAPTSPPPPPPAPTGTGSVALTPARPTQRHKLAVKIVISWRWDHRHTRLVRVKIGRVPGRTSFTITCRGRGCPAHKVHASAATLRRHHRTLGGKLYRAGDQLMISLSAPSWRPERARITIRSGRAPAVRLL
jgi:hypothetical protein